MDSMMMSTFIAGGVNIVLLVGILYPSLVNLVKTRSSVSALLTPISLIFLLQNVVEVFFHESVLYTPAMEFEVMTLTMMESFSFAALFWVTYK